MTVVLAVLTAICADGVIYQWLGAVLARRWLAETSAMAADEPLPPVTLLRPLKAGVPGLATNLDQLARALRPGDRLVLGAATDSAELAACVALRDAHPDRDIVVVPCREGAALNPKISKLVQMDSECRHDRMILSDSEALIDAAWLEALRHEWLAHDSALLTTPYRFIGAASWPQCLDAASALLALWPGLAVERRKGRVKFALGACTAIERRVLADVGGWAAFGHLLAEDHALGAAVAARGETVRLAATVATLQADPLGWRDWWRHQCRVARTYRVVAPRGFFGMALTHSSSAALALALLAACGLASKEWFFVAGAAFFLRWLGAWRLAKTIRFPLPRLGACVLLAGWMESLAWLRSWFAPRVWWAGRAWRVARNGTLAE